MTKVAEIVGGALALLRIVDAAEAPEAEDMATGISAMNMMMSRWEANGYSVGWSPVEAPSDEMPSPPEADEAIMYNLAVRLRARYGANLEEDVFGEARRLKSDVLADVFAANPMEMERTMAIRSGCYSIYRDGYDC